VRRHALGWLELSFDVLRALPEEIALRLLARAIVHVRGLPEAGRDMAGLERLLHWLREEDAPDARTLAGVHFQRRAGKLLAGREPGRIGPPLTLTPPREEIVWDDRYRLRFSGLRAPLRIMALGQMPAEAALPAEAPARPADASVFAWRAQPAVLVDDVLVAMPLSGWRAASAPFDTVDCTPYGSSSTSQ